MLPRHSIKSQLLVPRTCAVPLEIPVLSSTKAKLPRGACSKRHARISDRLSGSIPIPQGVYSLAIISFFLFLDVKLERGMGGRHQRLPFSLGDFSCFFF